MGKKQKVLIILLAVYSCFQNVSAENAVPGDVDFLIDKSLEIFEQVSDYTCLLEKKVNKDGVVYYDPEIMVKYKKPAQYYFKWGRGEFEGQEVIYAEGRNRDKLVAHSGGFFRSIKLHLDPDGKTAMKRNHHSLRRSGLEKIFDILEDSYDRYEKTGYGNITLEGEGFIDDREVWVIQSDFPWNKGFYAAKIILYMDREFILPVKVSVYDWSGGLYEEYTFHNLKINTGLDEDDFDPDNSEYNF